MKSEELLEGHEQFLKKKLIRAIAEYEAYKNIQTLTRPRRRGIGSLQQELAELKANGMEIWEYNTDHNYVEADLDYSTSNSIVNAVCEEMKKIQKTMLQTMGWIE